MTVCAKCSGEITFRTVNGLVRPFGCSCRNTADENTCSITSCPWCKQDPVWFLRHNGGCVYLDNLGFPWPIHKCWKEYVVTSDSTDTQCVTPVSLDEKNSIIISTGALSLYIPAQEGDMPRIASVWGPILADDNKQWWRVGDEFWRGYLLISADRPHQPKPGKLCVFTSRWLVMLHSTKSGDIKRIEADRFIGTKRSRPPPIAAQSNARRIRDDKSSKLFEWFSSLHAGSAALGNIHHYRWSLTLTDTVEKFQKIVSEHEELRQILPLSFKDIAPLPAATIPKALTQHVWQRLPHEESPVLIFLELVEMFNKSTSTSNIYIVMMKVIAKAMSNSQKLEPALRNMDKIYGLTMLRQRH
jgi:hypothetical protein